MLPSTKADWTFINTFADWFAAIGTFLAVVVSLYLARRDFRVRLRVNIGLRKILVGEGSHVIKEAPDYIVISVVNVGRRNANVTGLFWKNGLVRRRWMYQTPGAAPFSAQIPARLADGDSLDFTLSLNEFENSDAAEFGRFCLPRPRWLTSRFLRMQIRTSTGLTFKRRLEKELRCRLVDWVEGKTKLK